MTSIASPSQSITLIRRKTGLQAIDLQEVWQYRDLLLILTLREIQVRYKQTILGAFWAILQPLMTAGIFSVLLGLLMGRGKEPGVSGVPYAVYAFCAMLPWQLFANSLTQAGASILVNHRLITKVYFPRLIIPLSAVFAALVDFAIALVALALVMFWYHIIPSWPIILLPGFILLALLASTALGLWLSSLSVIYRDFRHLIPFIVQIGFFVSPVIYSVQSLQEKLPSWAIALYGLNPMAGVIDGFRWSLLGQGEAPGLILIPSILMTLALLVSGAYCFRHMERRFADLV
ncbi:MAG TPA: ABC transporter permease [Tepidisphaeraceae bacterium]|nr:ABC transporter permease [Tepidisphaeraceae bacterium]